MFFGHKGTVMPDTLRARVLNSKPIIKSLVNVSLSYISSRQNPPNHTLFYESNIHKRQTKRPQNMSATIYIVS